MDIKTIKKMDAYRVDIKVFQWLIAEVDRLKQLESDFAEEVENSAKHIACDRCVEKTAKRCVEIVNKTKEMSINDGSHADIYFVGACVNIEGKISKEFNLSKEC